MGIVHVIYIYDTVDENIERILQEQGYHGEVISAYTFRVSLANTFFDARDMPEILELIILFPK
jgi:hypothetical protein